MSSKLDDVLAQYNMGARGGAGFRRQQSDLHRLGFEASQAYARGLLTDSEFRNLRQSSRGSNPRWSQHVLFDAPGRFITGKDSQKKYSGSPLEAIGDILSLGSYASAGFFNESMKTKDVGGVKNPYGIGGALGGAGAGALVGGPAGAVIGAGIGLLGGTIFDPGTSLSGFAESWQNRQSYTDLAMRGGGKEDFWSNLALGLAGDILLDPTTYMTLGASAGAKLSVSAAMKSSAKGMGKTAKGIAATETGTKLTQTRFGSRMYQVASGMLQSKFA